MAAFATFAACETRAYAKRADNTWIDAHATRQNDGTLAVRVKRKLDNSQPAYGGWQEITDDATV